MSDEPIQDAPQPSSEQDAPSEERPDQEQSPRPSQAEGDDDDET